MMVLIVAMDAECDRILKGFWKKKANTTRSGNNDLLMSQCLSFVAARCDVEKTTDATACDSDFSSFPANTEGSERIC